LSLDDIGVVRSDRSHDPDNEFANKHAERSVDEQRSSTELLDGVKGHGSGAHIDEGGDERDQERVADCSER
jgi:hypothetical protein